MKAFSINILIKLCLSQDQPNPQPHQQGPGYLVHQPEMAALFQKNP
jgi:hypothetical protein